MEKDKQAKESLNKRQALSSAPAHGDTAPYGVIDLSSVLAEMSIDSVARYFGGNRYKPDKQASIRIHHCMDAVSSLASPRATYSLHSVTRAVPGKQIILANGSRISIPDCVEASESQIVAIVVGTLGAELEKHCRSLARRGEIYQSTLFDAVGTALLDLVSAGVCKRITENCAARGLAPGPRFAPGINGYPLEHQRLLFQLADHRSLGVSLNSSAIMVPAKSISFFQTFAKTTGIKRLKDKCSQCWMKDCQYRMACGAKDS